MREAPGDPAAAQRVLIATKFAAYPWRLTAGETLFKGNLGIYDHVLMPPHR